VWQHVAELGLDCVWKEYRLGTGGLREVISRATRGFRRGTVSPPEKSVLTALSDVSFQVGSGETLGIIGHNGAGKSTILKMLAGITAPTRGEVRVSGRVSSLIELGAGFHGDLTGRENIFLNGAIMGLSRRELTAKYDEIVEFAELERFIDTPLKRYSSGMQARLAFSVAVHLDPEVLLIDEVLSVGDYSFQRKSFDRILEFKKRGTHIVFVSHNLGSVATLCDRTLWMRRGQVAQIGRTPEVIEAYLRENDAEVAASTTDTGGEAVGGQGDVRIERSEFLDQFGRPADTFRFQDPIRIRLHYDARVPVERPYIQLGVSCDRGHLFMANMFFDECRPDVLTGNGYIDCCFENLPLLPGTYQVTCSVLRDYRVRYQELFNAGSFKVQSQLPEYGYKGELAVAVSRDSCPVYVPYHWDFAGTNNDQDRSMREPSLCK